MEVCRLQCCLTVPVNSLYITSWSVGIGLLKLVYSQEMLVGRLADNSNFKLGMVSGQRGRKEEYHFGLILGLHPLCLQEEQFAS